MAYRRFCRELSWLWVDVVEELEGSDRFG